MTDVLKTSTIISVLAMLLFLPGLSWAEPNCAGTDFPPPCYDVNGRLTFNKPAFVTSRRGIALFYKQQKYGGIIPWYSNNDPDKIKGVSKKKIVYAVEGIVLSPGFSKAGFAGISKAIQRTLEIYLHALANN